MGTLATNSKPVGGEGGKQHTLRLLRRQDVQARDVCLVAVRVARIVGAVWFPCDERSGNAAVVVKSSCVCTSGCGQGVVVGCRGPDDGTFILEYPAILQRD